MCAPNAKPSPDIFVLSRSAAAAAGFVTFTHTLETGSTNTDLVTAARSGDRTPALAVTDHQTAGRGRLDRHWVDKHWVDKHWVENRSAHSQLLVSFRFPQIGPAYELVTAVSVAARSSAAELSGVEIGLKWPNDLMVISGPRQGKLAGVLAELIDGEPPVVVVGLGLNIYPVDLDGAASLAENGTVVARDELLSRILTLLPDLLRDRSLLRLEYRRQSSTIGARVRVLRSDGELVGVAHAIDDDGRLVVNVNGSFVAVSVGDVIHLRLEEG